MPCAVLALLTCVSPPSRSPSIPAGGTGFLQLLALPPGALDRRPTPTNTAATWPQAITGLDGGRARTAEHSPDRLAQPPQSAQGELPAWPGSARTCAGSRRACCLQSIDPLPLPNPHPGWGGLSQTEPTYVPTCPPRAAGVIRARPGPFLNHPLLPPPSGAKGLPSSLLSFLPLLKFRLYRLSIGT